MATEKLSELMVEFKTVGFAPLQEAVAAFAKQLQGLADVVSQYGEKIDNSMKKAGASVASVGSAVASMGSMVGGALTVAAASTMGFVTAGIAASGVGLQLTFWMERLSRTIAGLFGPEIRRVIDLIAEFTNAIARLSTTQKEGIAQLLLLAMAFKGFASGGIFGIVGGVVSLALAFKQLKPLMEAVGKMALRLVDAFMPIIEKILDALTPAFDALIEIIGVAGDVLVELAPLIEAILVPVAYILGVIAKALSAVIKGIKAMIDALGPLKYALSPLFLLAKLLKELGFSFEHTKKKAEELRDEESKRVTGMEDPAAAWNRVAIAAMNVTAGIRGFDVSGGQVGAAAARLGGGSGTGDGSGREQVSLLEQIRDINSSQLNTLNNMKPAIA